MTLRVSGVREGQAEQRSSRGSEPTLRRQRFPEPGGSAAVTPSGRAGTALPTWHPGRWLRQEQARSRSETVEWSRTTARRGSPKVTSRGCAERSPRQLGVGSRPHGPPERRSRDRRRHPSSASSQSSSSASSADRRSRPIRSCRSARTARVTVLPTVVFNSAASRFKFSCVETSIRTLVLCMQISIQRRGDPPDRTATDRCWRRGSRAMFRNGESVPLALGAETLLRHLPTLARRRVGAEVDLIAPSVVVPPHRTPRHGGMAIERLCRVCAGCAQGVRRVCAGCAQGSCRNCRSGRRPTGVAAADECHLLSSEVVPGVGFEPTRSLLQGV